MSEAQGGPESASQPPADHTVLTAGTPIADREERLSAGADELAGPRISALEGRNVLVIAAGSLLTAGLTAIVLGWVGASRSTLIEEQVPYLISGGLLGVALAVVGAIAYFAHWLTVLVRDTRQQEAARAREHDELMAELRSLRSALARQEERNGTARSAGRERPVRRAPGRS